MSNILKKIFILIFLCNCRRISILEEQALQEARDAGYTDPEVLEIHTSHIERYDCGKKYIFLMKRNYYAVYIVNGTNRWGEKQTLTICPFYMIEAEINIK